MDIKQKITITLSEDDVKKIIVDYLCAEGYDVSSENVKLSVGRRYEGYGYGEHEVLFFQECTVSMEV